MYKILLDDDSFIVANDDYKIRLFHGIFRHVVTIKSYLINNGRFKKYYLLDIVNGNKVKRSFTIEPFDNTENFKVGSRIKLAKDIQVNDLILGVDNKPRRVKELHRGEDEMYEINVNGASYVVNGGHILELVDKETGEHKEMPVNIFMHMGDDFKSHYAMEKINM